MITCTFENGNPAIKGLRHVTVCVIALNEKNEVLLIRRSPQVPRGGFMSIPGGFLDRNETTAQAGLRELEEETGYRGEVQYLFQITDSPLRPKEDRQNVDFIYIVKITGGIERIDREVTEIRWATRETLPAEEEFAFDHRDIILSYFDYLEKPFALPLVK